MSPDDTEYYRARALDERRLARSAPSEKIAEIHNELARQYEAVADLPGVLPRLRIAI